jgi:hypothetical protein
VQSHGHVPTQEMADLVARDLKEIDNGPLRLRGGLTRLPSGPEDDDLENDLLLKGARKSSKKAPNKAAGFGNRS